MKFKELQVYGFKSFADKLQVKFGGGVTAIVGPNGCGKSNVADAIRWVLGEQSAKLLRGKSMADVIFSGTATRNSLSYCEVLLKFDNSEKMFPSLEYNEVTISRKLYRSGESIYYINGNQCKLKDISDLLHDGGMGREGYSIIGQGRIDELLSAKPENRRAIFEEAAGIAKFKARKLEAERKLVKTRDNLVRIEDILGEKAKQLEPLTIQSEKARKFLDLRDRLKEHEINIYIYQRDTSEEAKAIIKEKLKAVSEELNIKESDYNSIINEHKELQTSYESVDYNINLLHEELNRLNVGIEKQAGEINSLKQKKEFISQNKSKYELEIIDLENNNTFLQNRLKEVDILLKKNEEELAKSNIQYEKANESYLKSVDLLTLNRDRIESERKAELDAMERLLEIKANLSSLKAEKQTIGLHLEERNETKKDILSKLRTNENLYNEISLETDSLIKQKEELSNKLSKESEKNNEARFLLNEVNEKLIYNNNDFHALSSELKTLKGFKDAYNAFNGSVKNLLLNIRNTNLKDRVEGPVAQLIKVDAQLETAIQVALGASFQNIVVKTEEDANLLINHLRKERLGRVTFSPISSSKPRRIDPSFSPFLRTRGCIGIASNLIQYDPKYKNVMEALLGAIVIADNKETALELARKTNFSFKVVTLDGELFNTNGSITGGTLSQDKGLENIFSQERKINELNERINIVNKKISDLESQKPKLKEELAKAEDNIKLISKNVHALELLITSKMENLNQSALEKDNLSKQLEIINEQSEKELARLNIIETDLNNANELEEFLAKKRVSASESGLTQANALSEYTRESDILRDKSIQLKIRINELSSQVIFNKSEIVRLQKSLEDNIIKINSNLILIENAKKELIETEEKIILVTRTANENDTQEVKKIKEKINNTDKFKKDTFNRIRELEEKREQLTEVIMVLKDKKTRHTFELQSVDTDIEAKEEKLLEDYNLDYQSSLPFKIEAYDIEKGINEANKLKRSISNLGDVNVSSIEQCKIAYEEYSKYSSDRDDLLKGESDLVKIIRDLSKDMLKQFNENFEKIRVNFIKIFKELFNGGTADLYLTENDEGDPLSQGIEIVAQPPDKKLQSISLLSGGERALTAIAILFAILKLKPMPFCVLDEIEAALDDSNAGRFAKYLRRFSEETQFIVITHRKPTMELSDSLYGVTMEEKGVSKIVSVKLSTAVALGESVSA